MDNDRAWVLDPDHYRTGVWQLRPAFGGWQYRTKPVGMTWGPWTFKWGRRTRVVADLQGFLGAGWALIDEDDHG